jgi:hypothetical protein
MNTKLLRLLLPGAFVQCKRSQSTHKHKAWEKSMLVLNALAYCTLLKLTIIIKL